jgi:hypothetical protein
MNCAVGQKVSTFIGGPNGDKWHHGTVTSCGEQVGSGDGKPNEKYVCVKYDSSARVHTHKQGEVAIVPRVPEGHSKAPPACCGLVLSPSRKKAAATAKDPAPPTAPVIGVPVAGLPDTAPPEAEPAASTASDTAPVTAPPEAEPAASTASRSALPGAEAEAMSSEMDDAPPGVAADLGAYLDPVWRLEAECEKADTESLEANADLDGLLEQVKAINEVKEELVDQLRANSDGLDREERRAEKVSQELARAAVGVYKNEAKGAAAARKVEAAKGAYNVSELNFSLQLAAARTARADDMAARHGAREV